MNYDDLDPGIRETVRWLHGHGFLTCDSGDGMSKGDMECAMPFPNVSMIVSRDDMCSEADRLYGLLQCVGVQEQGLGFAPCIQSSYDPANGIAVLTMLNVDDEFLRMCGLIDGPVLVIEGS